MTAMEAQKKRIRAEMRELRRKVSAEERVLASRNVCDALLADAEIAKRIADRGAAVAVYMASQDELDISAFAVEILARGVHVVAPRWNGETYELSQLKGFDSGCLRIGPMGIREPLNPPSEDLRGTPCVWIVPGLAFTRDGNRIGYGGGWYDRLLADASPTALLVGVAYPFQIVVDIPHEPHDILLDKVFTADVGDVRLASGIGHGEIWYNTH